MIKGSNQDHIELFKENTKNYEKVFNPPLFITLNTDLFEIEFLFAKSHKRHATIKLTDTPTTKLEMEIRKDTGKIRGLITFYFR